MNVLTMLLATFVQSSLFTLRFTSKSSQTVFKIEILFNDYFPWRHLQLSSVMTGSSFTWHHHLSIKIIKIIKIIFNMNVRFSSCFLLRSLFHFFKFCLLFFPVSPWSSFIWPRVVWLFLQSSSPNQVHLDMCPPCLCTKCPPHVEQNGLFAISFPNFPVSMNLPTMTDMLNNHHHDGHRHDYLTRSCHLAWRYSATWWSATRFSASTRSTCQIKR